LQICNNSESTLRYRSVKGMILPVFNRPSRSVEPPFALLLLALLDARLESRQKNRPTPCLRTTFGASDDGPIGHGAVELDEGRAALGTAQDRGMGMHGHAHI